MQLNFDKSAQISALQESLCQIVNTERDLRSALDFSYDFGTTNAIFDNGTTEVAGVRSLQASTSDIANWTAIYSASLAQIISGNSSAILPMRVQDNANIQTTCSQVITALSALFVRNSGILFYAGTIKTQIRAMTTLSQLNGFNLNSFTNWPS